MVFIDRALSLRLRLRLLGAVAVLWSSVSGEGREQIAPR